MASGTLSIKSATQNVADPTRWVVVFDGNTSGTLVAQGYKIRLSPTAAVTDLANNVPAGAECAPGVPVVEVPSPIPVRKVWLKDVTGDGSADRMYIQFAKPSARSIKASDMPSQVALTWASALDVATASSGFLISNSDSTIWELPIGPMTKGATVGYNSGNGSVEFSGLGRSGDSYVVEDSVSPIPVKASLRYAADGDYLTVGYSEAVKTVDVAGNYMLWKTGNGADQTLNVLDIPTTTDNISYVFKLQSSSITNPNPGDSVRLPLTGSKIVAANGTLPSITAASPYVVVTGGDRPPKDAWYLDTNADGIADALGMVFATPLKTSPTFVFQLGSESRTINAASGLTVAADGLTATVSFAANPFTAIQTSVGASDIGSMTSTMGDVVATASFAIRDSMDPVILSAVLRYASYSDASHSMDTLTLKLSEPVIATGDNVIWGAFPEGQRSVRHVAGTVSPLTTATDVVTMMFDTTSSYDQLGSGDLVRVAPLAGGEMVDLKGNAPPLDSMKAKWTPIQAGLRPPRFDVGIYPSALMVIDPAKNPDVNGFGTGTQMTVWVSSKKLGNNLLYPVNGSTVGNVGVDTASVRGNAIGPKFTVNGPFEANALVYDNMGVFVGQTNIKVDTAMINQGGFAAKDGSFEVVILWNGRNLSNLPVGSGIYMFRVVVYRDQEDGFGRKVRAMVMNQVTKVGVKISTK